MISAGTSPQAQAARQLSGLHDYPAKVREQPFHADPVLA
jgi:hypothetical protein